MRVVLGREQRQAVFAIAEKAILPEWLLLSFLLLLLFIEQYQILKIKK